MNGTSSRGDYIATAGQTTFTLAGGYDPGYVDVFLNGVKQVPTTDFTATDGSNIVFGVGLTVGDEVSIIAFGTFVLADHYTKLESDAKYLPINAVTLPDQTGHAGQYLTTNGSTASWGDTGAINGAFWVNNSTITTSTTIASGTNAGTFGPVAIADGVTITVADGATWTVV